MRRCLRSRTRSPSTKILRGAPSQSPAVKVIATRNGNFSTIWVNADEVSNHLLQHAKMTATGLLQMTGQFDEALGDFPYHTDGGWEAIDPEDDFVTYAHLRKGLTMEPRLEGSQAVAIGRNTVKRQRGAALGLVVHAAMNNPLVITSDMLENHPELLGMVEATKESLRLVDASGARSTASRSSVDRATRRPRSSERRPRSEETQGDEKAEIKRLKTEILEKDTEIKRLKNILIQIGATVTEGTKGNRA